MTHVSANGQSEFRSSLRHQSEPLRQATSMCPMIGCLSSLSILHQYLYTCSSSPYIHCIFSIIDFSGPINSLHGDALNQNVRKAAIELIELLFNIENPESVKQSYIVAGPTGQVMEGFGNTPNIQNTTILDTVKGLGNQITGYINELGSTGYHRQTSNNTVQFIDTKIYHHMNHDRR